MSDCPSCGSELVTTVPTPHGPHHAKAVCSACGRFLRWLPRPTPSAMPEPTRGHQGPAATLRGSSAQVEAAERIRDSMIRLAGLGGLKRTTALLKSVNDASWFFANRERNLDDLKWPTPEQMDQPKRDDEATN